LIVKKFFFAFYTALTKLQIQNTVLLTGYIHKDETSKVLGEFDFLILSSYLKTVIHIEAKKSYNDSNRKKACQQLDKGKLFFKENFPFPNEENWSYIKMACFGESVENVCPKCKPFVISFVFEFEGLGQNEKEHLVQEISSSWLHFETLKELSGTFLLLNRLFPTLSPFAKCCDTPSKCGDRKLFQNLFYNEEADFEANSLNFVDKEHFG
jgi:hypothetical protein